MAKIFRGSEALVTPSISLLISARTWLRKMFLMYMVRNSLRGHCLAGPSSMANSISWMNLEHRKGKNKLNINYNSITLDLLVFFAILHWWERPWTVPA